MIKGGLTVKWENSYNKRTDRQICNQNWLTTIYSEMYKKIISGSFSITDIFPDTSSLKDYH